MSATSRSLLLVGGLLAATASPLGGAVARAADAPQASAHQLRVCADPDYLPFSNQNGDGFENKVAALLAHSMGRELTYKWASTRGRGGFSNFLADNLDAGKCDVVMNLPYGDHEESYTNPYYVSSYVFVQKDHGAVTSMTSPGLRGVKIGFEDDTTPETGLKMMHLTDQLVVFHVADDPGASPEQFLQAVQTGQVGVMITWEPAVGYFLKRYPDLHVTQVPAEEYGPGLPQISYTYSMAIGVREHDTALRDEINRALDSNKTQVAAILNDYNVKLYKPADTVNFSQP